MKNRVLFFIWYLSASVLFFAGSPSLLPAQNLEDAVGGVCSISPDCIINSNLDPNGPGAGGNMNSSTPNTVPGWYISHGTPSITGGAPSGPPYGIWMWSYSGTGEGVFTCYNFQQGHTYQICFWVLSTNSVSAGNLMVYAANGLVPIAPSGFGGPPPVPASQQLISNTFVNSPVWTQVTYTFTPTANYKQLWIYPFMAAPPSGGQYELAIDLVRVQETFPAASITSTANPITWCQSATLCASGSPTGTYTWSPATGLNTTTGSCVIASPCSTTTYTVNYGTSSSCQGCSPVTNTYTLVVVPPDIQAISNGPVPCGEEILLSTNLMLYCPDIILNWYDASNNYVGSGPSVSIPNANAGMSGTYRLEVNYGGCTMTRYVTVEVTDCPCEFNADFTFTSRLFCHPVTFTDASYGPAAGVSWFWDFGDGGTSSLQNPTHTFASSGMYSVCLTVVGKSGRQTCCSQICKKVFCGGIIDDPNALMDGGTNIDAHTSSDLPPEKRIPSGQGNDAYPARKAELTVIPNPATDQAFISIKNMDKPVVSLMDMNGSLLSLARLQSDGRYLVDLSGISSGIYLVVAEDAGGKAATKLVKQ